MVVGKSLIFSNNCAAVCTCPVLCTQRFILQHVRLMEGILLLGRNNDFGCDHESFCRMEQPNLLSVNFEM